VFRRCWGVTGVSSVCFSVRNGSSLAEYWTSVSPWWVLASQTLLVLAAAQDAFYLPPRKEGSKHVWTTWRALCASPYSKELFSKRMEYMQVGPGRYCSPPGAYTRPPLSST